jgi:hypothetical protein
MLFRNVIVLSTGGPFLLTLTEGVSEIILRIITGTFSIAE